MAISLLRQLIGLRVRNQNLPFTLYAAWLVISCLALITLPAFLWLGVVPWELPPPRLLPLYVLGIAYLLYALILFFAARQHSGISIYLAAVIGALCFLFCAGILGFVEALEFSRRVLLGSAVAGVALAIYPLLLNRLLFVLSSALLLLAVMSVMLWMLLRPDTVEADKVERLISSRYVIDKVTYQSIPNMPNVEGGAITRQGNGFIVATGDGQFYRLNWSPNGNNLVSVKLPLASPLVGRAEFYANKASAALQFRVTDLLIQPSDDGDTLVVAHQVWDQPDNCFRMGVSRATLPEASAGETAALNAWTTLYETTPCIAQPFDTVETGGRLAWLGPDQLLLTVGDHGQDGRRNAALAQDPNADYGKVLLLDTQGGARILTSGHRNPQGLLVDPSGHIWITEHGPAGGDEINLLVAGRNYGWPLVTYGTDYGKRTWPLNPDGRDHGGFVEPVYAFVPAVAISDLIQLGGAQFPRWEGDFLIGSLRMETLYRARVRENRVIFIEPIFLGKRVRDMVEGPDGRVVVWSDDESVTVLARRLELDSGEDTFGQCSRCHEPMGKAPAMAPDLKGIIGRNIASRKGFTYSAGLTAIEGVWTEERLLAFLKDPQQFAPGTTMAANGIPDNADRAALVAYLRNYGAKGP